MGFLSPQWMLLAGIILSFPFARLSSSDRPKRLSTWLLQLSVVCLGAGLDFNDVLSQGPSGLLLTGGGIALVFSVAHLLNRAVKLDSALQLLITAGTAICGGSAIGALAPAIGASSFALTIAMVLVFLLNAVAMFIFPFIGNALGLSQIQFGELCALAIHDTSSVVAAASLYGQKALEVATMLKLTRALWIVPLVLAVGLLQGRERQGKLSFPWFILGFVIASLLFTYLPIMHAFKPELVMTAKLGFSLTLFLVGLSFRWEKLKQVGARPLVFAVSLWAVVIGGSLLYVTQAHAQVDRRAQLQLAREQKIALIDVREKEEVEAGMLPGAVWFPLSQTEADPQWVEKFKRLVGGKPVALYCRSGNRSGIMQNKLAPHGIRTENLGGYEELRRLK